MRFFLLYITLLFNLTLVGQHESLLPVGIGIKFKETVSEEKQIAFVRQFYPLLSLDNQSNLFLSDRLVALFPPATTEPSALEIKEKVEQSDLVEFTSLLKGKGKLLTMPLEEVYIKLKNENDLALTHTFAAKNNLVYVSKFSPITRVHVFRCTKKTRLPSFEIADDLNKTGLFEYASHNSLYSLSVMDVNDPNFKWQWSIRNEGTIFQSKGTPGADMDVDSAWTLTTGSPNIKIAVLDSGIDTLHPDLKDNLLPGFDAKDNKTKGHPTANISADGHGTACAGIIAAKGNNGIGTAGIAYECKLIPIRIYNFLMFNGQAVPLTTTQAGIDGIIWAAYTAKADLASNSWGVHDTVIPLLKIDTALANDVIDDVTKNGRDGKGLPLLYSSGNDPDPFTIWPSRLKNTISVGATSMCDELKNENDCSPENWGSNHGKGLDVSAPGVRIATSDISGAGGYTSNDYNMAFNGTSSACPNAAGVLALILSVDSSFSYATAREILETTCDTVGGYNYDSTNVYGAWSMELGYGRVNAYSAVKKAYVVKNTPKPKAPEREIGLYPNPTTGLVTLNVGKEFISEITITNFMGSVVESYTQPPSGIIQLNIAGYSKGVYLVLVKTETSTTAHKLIKQD